jgi:hypothetical protein
LASLNKFNRETSFNSNILLITFATEAFVPATLLLDKRARKFGFDDLKIRDFKDLDSTFIQDNWEILRQSRGAGYWLWKPYIIKCELDYVKKDDFCLYLDAGAVPNKSADFFIEIARDGLIHLWRESKSKKYSNRYWSDPNVWNEIVGSDSGLDDNQVWAGAILFSNNPTSRRIFAEWLELCCQPKFLCPDKHEDYVFAPGQVGHRHDQTLLNCILQKYPNCFIIHDLENELIIHRTGTIKSNTSLWIFRFFRTIYFKIMKLLPPFVKLRIMIYRTKITKPWVTDSEIESHKRFWLETD